MSGFENAVGHWTFTDGEAILSKGNFLPSDGKLKTKEQERLK